VANGGSGDSTCCLWTSPETVAQDSLAVRMR
jgi:hypothetical protein